MIKPAGLARFSRVISTKFAGTCVFCTQATTPGTDFAVLNSANKWLAVCATCATSPVAQVKAVVADAIAIATPHQAAVEAAQVEMPDTVTLTSVMAGTATEAVVLATLRQVFAMRREVQAIATRLATPEPEAVLSNDLAPGLYILGPEGEWASYWRVTIGRGSGRTYAMRLVSEPREGEKLDWEYVKGGLRDVRRGRPATAEEIASLGVQSHFCCFCSTELTDDRTGHSIDRGYGPICANKYGLPWGDPEA